MLTTSRYELEVVTRAVSFECVRRTGVDSTAGTDDEHSFDNLLTGYVVTLSAGGERIVVRAPATRTLSRLPLWKSGSSSTGVRHNLVYTVTVEAVYADETLTSKAASCHVPIDGLP